MSGGTCGGCTHWKHPRTDFQSVAEGTSYGWDDEPPTPEEQAADAVDLLYGECTAIRMGRVDASEFEAPPVAIVLDGSEYKATLYSRAEFTCALWEAKP